MESSKQSLKKQIDPELSGQRFLIIITSGDEPDGKAGLGFAHAAHLAANGFETLVFLTLDGSKWAFEQYGHIYQHPCFDSPRNNMKNAADLGAKFIVCNTCIEAYKDDFTENILDFVEIGGLSAIDEFSKNQVVTITY